MRAQQVRVSKLGFSPTGNCWFCHHQLRPLPAAHLVPASNSILKLRTTRMITTTTTTTTTTTMMMMTTPRVAASVRFGTGVKFNPDVVCSENKKHSRTLFTPSTFVFTFGKSNSVSSHLVRRGAGGVISESDTDRIYPASTVCWSDLAFKLNQLVDRTNIFCNMEKYNFREGRSKPSHLSPTIYWYRTKIFCYVDIYNHCILYIWLF